MGEKKLLTKLKEEIRRRNYSYKTEKAYSQWIVRYVKFHGLKHLGMSDMRMEIFGLRYAINKGEFHRS